MNKFRWLVESKYATEDGYPQKIEYNSLKVLTKKQKLPYKDCILRSSIGSAHSVLRLGRCNIRTFLGREKNSFDTNVFMNQFDELAFNYEHIYQTWGNIKKMFNGYSNVFIRPVNPWKPFAAGVLSKENMYGRLCEDKLPDHTLCLISTAKPIEHEYRLIVCGREVVGGSEYLTEEQPNIPNDVLNCATEFLKVMKETPDDIFCLDIVQSNNKIFLLETSSFTTSGLYASDIPTVCKKVESYLERLDSEDSL